jgi:type IV pilus assembly protein PilN
MIRINLLPREGKAQRKPAFSLKVGDLVVPVAMLAAAGLVIAGTAVSQKVRVAALEKSIAEVEAQSRALAPQIERVQRLAQERAELDLRLGIINRLEQGRTASVRLMDEMARCVPDHLWLTSASQEGGRTVVLEGVTFSNLVVSDFMSRLERSPMFAQVELDIAERGQSGDRDIVKFRVNCQVTPDQAAN